MLQQRHKKGAYEVAELQDKLVAAPQDTLVAGPQDKLVAELPGKLVAGPQDKLVAALGMLAARRPPVALKRRRAHFGRLDRLQALAVCRDTILLHLQAVPGSKLSDSLHCQD